MYNCLFRQDTSISCCILCLAFTSESLRPTLASNIIISDQGRKVDCTVTTRANPPYLARPSHESPKSWLAKRLSCDLRIDDTACFPQTTQALLPYSTYTRVQMYTYPSHFPKAGFLCKSACNQYATRMRQGLC